MTSTLDTRISDFESMMGFTLRSCQRQALSAPGSGKHVILHVPTGGGKDDHVVVDSSSEEVRV